MNDPASRQIRPARSLALLWGETARLDRLRRAGDLPGPVVVLAPAESLKTQAPEADLIPVEGVLSAEPGEAWLTGHSLPGLFSLKPASAALRQVFPGLRARREIAVPRIAPAALLPWFAPGAEGGAAEIALVLDTPGSEIEMLELLDGAGLLARVGTLHLRCTAETGFDGGADEAGIVRWLEDRLFACRARNTEDADWPELVFAPDARARRLIEVEARLTERDAALKAAQEALAQREAALAEARGQVEAGAKTIDERDAALQEASDKLAARDKALAEARGELEARARTIAERDAALQEAKDILVARDKALAESRSKAEAQAKTITEQNAALKAVQETRAQSETALAEARSQLDARDKTLAERDTALQEASDKLAARDTALTEALFAAEASKGSIAALEAELEALRHQVDDRMRERDAARVEENRLRDTASIGQQQLLQKQDELAEAQEQLKLLYAELHAMTEKSQAVQDELVTAIREREATQAELVRLTEALELAHSEVVECDTARRELAEAAARVDIQHAAERDAARVEENRLREVLNMTKATLAEREEALAQLTRSASQLRASLAAEREQAQAKQAEAESSLAIAMRLQVIAMNDLSALRDKYKVAQEARVAQEALLRALTPRLQEAASQVRTLMQTEPPAAPIAVVGAEQPKMRSRNKKNSNRKK